MSRDAINDQCQRPLPASKSIDSILIVIAVNCAFVLEPNQLHSDANTGSELNSIPLKMTINNSPLLKAH